MSTYIVAEYRLGECFQVLHFHRILMDNMLTEQGRLNYIFLTLKTLTLGFGSAAERPIKPFKKSIAITFLKLAQLIKRAVLKMCSSLES